MLYQVFDLQRDTAMQRTSYGAMASVGYNLGRSFKELINPSVVTPDPSVPEWVRPQAWDGVLSIGLTLAFDTPRQLPIYKSIELWTERAPGVIVEASGKRRKLPAQSILLERLLYRSDKGLVPFCWRHIDAWLRTSTLVHCTNLETIHGSLQGLSNLIKIDDPRQIYLDTLAASRTWCHEERLQELQHAIAESTHGRMFSQHEFVPDPITQTLQKMTHQLSWSFDPDWDRHTPQQVYQNFVVAAHRVDDPISLKTPFGAITESELMRYYVTPSFDVSPPEPLSIPYPELTQTQSRIGPELAEALDHVRLTDYAITARNLDLAPDTAALYNTAQILARYMVQTCDDRVLLAHILDSAEIEIHKTFGEEALVTMRSGGRVLAAYHIDFAMLAFCSMGLAVDVPLWG